MVPVRSQDASLFLVAALFQGLLEDHPGLRLALAHAVVVQVHDAVMVHRVARRVDQLEGSRAVRDALAVGRDDDARFVDRDDLAVELAIALLAVDRDRARDQPRRLGKVLRAARVHYAARVLT